MEVRAVSKSVRMSPRKVRLVADSIRNLSIANALEVLTTTQKRAGLPLFKTLKSAVANAKINNNIDEGNLTIAKITVNEAQALKRFHPSSRGRVHPYKNKGSHITVILKEKAVKATPAAKQVNTGDKTVKKTKPAETKAKAEKKEVKNNGTES